MDYPEFTKRKIVKYVILLYLRGFPEEDIVSISYLHNKHKLTLSQVSSIIDYYNYLYN